MAEKSNGIEPCFFYGRTQQKCRNIKTIHISRNIDNLEFLNQYEETMFHFSHIIIACYSNK